MALKGKISFKIPSSSSSFSFGKEETGWLPAEINKSLYDCLMTCFTRVSSPIFLSSNYITKYLIPRIYILMLSIFPRNALPVSNNFLFHSFFLIHQQNKSSKKLRSHVRLQLYKVARKSHELMFLFLFSSVVFSPKKYENQSNTFKPTCHMLLRFTDIVTSAMEELWRIL